MIVKSRGLLVTIQISSSTTTTFLLSTLSMSSSLTSSSSSSIFPIGKPIINQLSLSEDNYSDALFIHPPLFVYLSAILHHYLHIPLPMLPLLYQFITMLIIPYLIQQLLLRRYHRNSHNAFTHSSQSATITELKSQFFSMVLYSICPILGFVSQKVNE